MPAGNSTPLFFFGFKHELQLWRSLQVGSACFFRFCMLFVVCLFCSLSPFADCVWKFVWYWGLTTPLHFYRHASGCRWLTNCGAVFAWRRATMNAHPSSTSWRPTRYSWGILEPSEYIYAFYTSAGKQAFNVTPLALWIIALGLMAVTYSCNKINLFIHLVIDSWPLPQNNRTIANRRRY